MVGSLNVLFLLAAWTVDIWGQPFVGVDADGNTTVNPQNTSQCWLVADNEFRDQLSGYLGGKPKLIEMTINLRGHPEDMLSHSLKDVYMPYNWIRSTSHQGRSLLTLGDHYKHKSMMTLSIGVVSMEIDVSDLPARCMHGRNPEETLNIIRQSFFRNFIGPLGENKSTFGAEEHLCNVQIFKEGQYAQFQYRCCQLDSGGNMVCHDLSEDDWIAFLLFSIKIIKFLILVYSPLFIPECLYRQKYLAGKYIYHDPEAPMTLKVTQDPDQFGEVSKQKTIQLSELKGLKHVKDMLSNNDFIPGKIYEINVQEVWLSVKSRRLLDGVSVPVTLTTILYNSLLRCRLRKLEPLKECCASRILGKFKPDVKCITWHQCLTWLAQFCLLILLATPWIIRAILYFAYEAAVIEDKKRVAKEMGLELNLPLRVLGLSEIIALIVILIIFIIEFIFFCVTSSSVKEELKCIKQCLCDMKEGSSHRVAILAWIAKLTVVPFQKYGIVGLVFFLPYLAVVIVISVLLVSFYSFTTINLIIRISLHFSAALYPQKVQTTLYMLQKLLHTLKKLSEELQQAMKLPKLPELTFNENLVDRHRDTTKGTKRQQCVVLMCIMSFWSLTMLLSDLVSFYVEIFAYTFMGLIVNAGVILPFLTVLVMVVVYCKNSFSRVYPLYQSYHKIIHRQLMAMAKEGVTQVARQEALEHENTAFIVQEEAPTDEYVSVSPQTRVKIIHSEPMAIAREEVTQVTRQEALDHENTAFIVQEEAPTDEHVSVSPQTRVKNHQLQWKTSGMLVFLDKKGTPFTPKKFFYKTIDLNYFGCPGPIYRNVCSAVWDFLKILLFLMFVFVVVMALGDTYQISTTNQLLATAAGSFVPFIFRYFFAERRIVDDIDESSIEFKTELNKAIKDYTQFWPVLDIKLAPGDVKECDTVPETAASEVDVIIHMPASTRQRQHDTGTVNADDEVMLIQNLDDSV